MNMVSLFAGIGGIDLAFERDGIHTAAAVELDTAARGVIADRMPDTTLMTDVTEVTGDDLRAASFDPRTGVLAAGWPCQGNSVAGRRGGMDDPRSGLWRHVVRLLAEARPRWFVGENVPGLLSVNGGQDFGAVIRDLDDLGYGVAWRVLDAQYFGVPQRRRRVFIVGCLGDGATPAQVLLEPEGRGGDSAPRREAGARVAALTANGLGGGGPDDNLAQGGHLIAEALAPTLEAGANQTGGVRPPGTTVDTADSLIPFDAAQITSDENRANPQAGDPAPTLADTGRPHVASTLTANANGGRRQEDDVNIVTHALTAEGADASEDGTGRGTPLVADTVRSHPRPGSNSNGALTVEATAVRRLTPTECERLQGFPDGWTLTSNGRPQSDSARYRQLGNAVAVPCVEWIARRLVAADREAVTG